MSSAPPSDRLPDFDFGALRLCRASRDQLSTAYGNALSSTDPDGCGCRLLFDYIVKYAFRADLGAYLTLTKHFGQTVKLPHVSKKVARVKTVLPVRPFKAQFFANALNIPKGYGDNGPRPPNTPPKKRATNVGFVVTTLEVDCRTSDEFEETLSWMRPYASSERTRIDDLDAHLGKVEEYRGYTVVFTGRRSLHFHFVFSTEHFVDVPSGLAAPQRRERNWARDSVLMHRLHDAYWDFVHDAFCDTLQSRQTFDRSMRSVTQLRRAPWAVRVLDEGAPILGLPPGTAVPQIVIREKIGSGRARGAGTYLVPGSLSLPEAVG